MATIADRARALLMLPSVETAPETPTPTMPRPRQIVPNPPPGMSDQERAIWTEVTGEMQHLGIIDRLDRWAIARYCSSVVKWQMLDADLKTLEGIVVVYESGAEQVSGRWTALKQTEQTLAQLEGELGLTPASRARLMFATYGGRVLAVGSAEKKKSGGQRGPRGAYRKKGAAPSDE